jgi:hypothetical protein
MAVASGKKLGRRQIDPAIERKAHNMHEDGAGMLRIAGKLDLVRAPCSGLRARCV